jgi:hypothetical protein
MDLSILLGMILSAAFILIILINRRNHSLLGCPFIQTVRLSDLDRRYLSALAAGSEDVDALLTLALADLQIDEFVVGPEVGGELGLLEGVLVGNIEVLEELAEGFLDPFILGGRKVEHLHQELLEVGVKVLQPSLAL